MGAALLALSACASSDGAPTTDHPATSATTPTTAAATTTLPPLTAGAIGDWDGQSVASVCVQVTQTYPQVSAYEYDVTGVVRDLLGPVGVLVQPDFASCDAVLGVDMSLEGRAAEYEDLGTLYSGMLRRLDMSLMVVTREPLTFHHLTDLEPGEIAASTSPTTPEAFVEHWASAWPTIVLDGLVQFWGPAVAIEALRDDTYGVTAYAALCELSGAGPGECLPSDYDVWRAWFEQQP